MEPVQSTLGGCHQDSIAAAMSSLFLIPSFWQVSFYLGPAQGDGLEWLWVGS